MKGSPVREGRPIDTAPETSRSILARGAAFGLFVGVAYAAVESLALSLATYLARGPELYRPQTAAAALACIATYGACSALCGCIAAAVVAGWGKLCRSGPDLQLLRCLVLLVPPLAVFAAIAPQGFPEAQRLAIQLWTGAAIGALLSAGVLIVRLRPLVLALLGPWTVALVLVGVPWLLAVPLAERPGDGALVSWTIGYALAVLVLAALAAHLARRAPERSFVLLAGIALAGVLASAWLQRKPLESDARPAGASAGARSPNVILITLDTVRADHLSLYGYARDTAPGLKELALQATLYRHAVAPASHTLPSHASLFTGLYPRGHGAHGAGDQPSGVRPLRAEFTTLAETLASHGFRTAAIVANHAFLSRTFGLDQGFDIYDDREPVPLLPDAPGSTLRSNLFRALLPLLGEAPFRITYRKADAITDEALELAERMQRDGGPWFLFLNYMDAHAPWGPPPPFDTLFPGKLDELEPTELFRRIDDVNALRDDLDPRLREHMLSQYDGGVAFADSQLRRLVARLRELGAWDQCLFIVTSDHGEAFGERSLVTHGLAVYQDEVGVPLLIKRPGQTTGAVETELASLVDLAPTILALLGLTGPAPAHGRDLAAADQRELEQRPVLSEMVASARVARLHPRFAFPQRAVLWGRFKLVESGAGALELYDLEADPDETRPLTGDEFRAIRERLAAELERYLDQVTPGKGAGDFAPAPIEDG